MKTNPTRKSAVKKCWVVFDRKRDVFIGVTFEREITNEFYEFIPAELTFNKPKKV